MSKIVGMDCEVHFGEVGKELPDWREELLDEDDPDDEELEATPQDVVAMMGFDPLEGRP